MSRAIESPLYLSLFLFRFQQTQPFSSQSLGHEQGLMRR
jgi:hypothetical protein